MVRGGLERCPFRLFMKTLDKDVPRKAQSNCQRLRLRRPSDFAVSTEKSSGEHNLAISRFPTGQRTYLLYNGKHEKAKIRALEM